MSDGNKTNINESHFLNCGLTSNDYNNYQSVNAGFIDIGDYIKNITLAHGFHCPNKISSHKGTS